MIEPPEVPHHHAHHEGSSRPGWLKFVVEAVMPISVLLLSIGSLYVALHTGSAMDKLVAHNEKLVKAQSTPILQYSTGNYDPDQQRAALSFTIANVGTGPARLHWLRVFADDGKQVHETFRPWLYGLADAAELETMRRGHVLSSDLDGTVIPARDQLRPLIWAKPAESEPLALALWERANTERHKLSVALCYCSVFDECWQEQIGKGPARPLPRCEAPPPVSAAASKGSR